MSALEPLALARRLARMAGRDEPLALDRLAGGRNNRVFRAVTGSGEPLILKLYHSDPRDGRDRLAAEWQFIAHARSRGIRTVPAPLAGDRDAHAALYSFVPGRRLLPAEIGEREVDAALDFVLAVNAEPRGRQSLPEASEACFSLAQHIATVDRRIARLAALDPEAPCRDAAERFVARALAPAWEEVKAGILREAEGLGIAVADPAPASEIILSPSDFGFHNALADEGRLTFIDFEYAGRDDAAKLASDFFCQPEVPVSAGFHARFVERLARGLGFGDGYAARCGMLLDAYRIKWACIILNDFLPLGSARRAFADHARSEERCVRQLASAESKLGMVGNPPRRS